MRERIETFGDLRSMDEAGEFSFYVAAPTYKKEQLLWKKEPDTAKTLERLQRTLALLELISEKEWSEKRVKEVVWPYAESEGRGEVLWPMRFSLSGREKSPDPFVIAGMIGKDETQKRIRAAIALLS
jgi:hypothetical protein